ncbi:tapasin-related protein isoform X2 [Salvelinus sp. IW2-2015]|uniref:tapasin-related protein isoform X2 n=1 Tax=Salvelinus sp. IW2-2015 TaxID=2691554 RepID=UPI000CDF8B55|nr:tapasin-related protein isoform X2 [Salvelinus alpinus]
MKIFTVLLCLIPYAGVLGFLQVQWLRCRLTDEYVWTNAEGHVETNNSYRDAVLQFDNSGNSAMLSDSITFLVAASKVDMRKFVEGPVDRLQCDIHRYSKGISRVRWPSLGGTAHDIWFTCTLRHTAGLYNITSFLRVTPATTMSAHQPDFFSWLTIGVKEKISASAVMVLMTRSPSVRVGLQKETTLHCQFAVDHKVPHLTVEWHLQRHGERRTKLFSYSSSSEPPDVSLTTKEEQIPSVVCEANGFYPLDVEIDLFKETSSGQRPEKLGNVLHSSHLQHHDGTHSLAAFVRLRPSPQDSGCAIYSCRVSHVSLQGLYIHKSIIGPGCWTWFHLTLPGLVCLVLMIIFIAVTRRRFFNKTVRRR